MFHSRMRRGAFVAVLAIVAFIWTGGGLAAAPGTFIDTGQNLAVLPSEGVVLADFDGDGDADAYVANTSGWGDRVWLNDGTGTFTDSGQSLGTWSSLQAAVGDLDGDGDTDVFVATDGIEPDLVWLNDGSGHFFDSGQRLGAAPGYWVDLGDVDGDGDLDAFVVAPSGFSSVLWLNDGFGNFSDSGQQFPITSANVVGLRDLDGDGDLDAFVTSAGQGRVLFNNGLGVFSDSGQSLGNDPTTGVDFGDVEGDGDLDVVVGNRNWYERIWLNTGTGFFMDSGQRIGGTHAYGQGHTMDVRFGDLDSDGDLDLAIGNDLSESNEIWLNDGTGVFVDSGQRLGGFSTRGLGLSDMDRDGDLDVFEANTSNHPNRVYLNQTNPTALPVADAGGPYVTELSGPAGTAVMLDGRASFDPKGGALSFQWVASGIVFDDPTSSTPSGTFPLGTTTVVLTVSDGVRIASDEATVRVTSESTTGQPGSFAHAGETLFRLSSQDVEIGDLDGDGDLDAFVTHDRNLADRVYLNDGTGSFTDSGQTLSWTDSKDAVLGDLNNDGSLDVFLVAGSDLPNEVWLNDGAGHFTDSGQRLGANDGRGADLGDIDGDGDLDVVVSNSYGDAHFVWLNDGSGVFTDSGQRLDPTNSAFVRLADLDGDGDLDLYQPNGGAPDRVYLNDGTGTFVDSGQRLGWSGSQRIDVGDVDGDGDLDVLVANRNQPQLLWLNDGSGRFTDSGQLLGGYYQYGPGHTFDAKLADFDNDGDLDAFFANDLGEAGEVWLNNGHGEFTDSGQRLGGYSSRALGLGDFDGDGDVDVLSTSKETQPDVFWRNLTDPNPLPVARAGGEYHADATSAGGADVGLDGRSSYDPDGDTLTWHWEAKGIVFDDAASPTPAARFPIGTTRVELTVSDGVLLAKDVATVVVTDPSPSGVPGAFVFTGQNLGNTPSWEVALGDVDGDGDLDAFVGNISRMPDRLYLNDGTGSFADSGQAIGANDTVDVLLGDLDGDGDLDAFLVGGFQRPSEVWLNSGSGTFTDSGQRLGSNDARAGALGDIDADGDLDVVVASTTGFASYVWLNDGTGQFTDSGQRLDVGKAEDVRLGDLDGDGDLDALFAQPGSKVFFNDGEGRFTDSGQWIGWFGSSAASLGDVDGDGDLDVLFAMRNFYKLLYLNDGSGHFTESGQRIGAFHQYGEGHTREAALVDVDNDGDLDAFLVNDIGETNEVWLNNGFGDFTDSGQRLGGLPSTAVELGDLDGDGDLDAFVTNGENQPDRVYLNQTDPVPGNEAPVAVANGPYAAEYVGPLGTSVILSAAGSQDPDGDPLTYHWTASGAAFDDPDSATPIGVFPLGSTTVTLTVSDGALTDTAVAQVEVTDSFATTSALATNSIWMKLHSEVSGDVVVNDASLGPWLSSDVELAVGKSVRTAAGRTLRADSIKVKSGAVVASDVYANEIDNNGTITGEIFSPLSLPVLSVLPPFRDGATGSESIFVAQDETLELGPGTYGAIQVRQGGSVVFSGGAYDFTEVDFGRRTSMLFLAPSEVRVGGRFSLDENSVIGKGAGAAVSNAREIVIYVAGINGCSGALGGTPRAAKIGTGAQVYGRFLVPNGTLWTRENAELTGMIFARDLIVGRSVKLLLE